MIQFNMSWKFEFLLTLGDKISCKHYPKGNICTCGCFNKTWMVVSCWIGDSSWTTPKTKFHFISPTMKSNVNRISFMVVSIPISGTFLECYPVNDDCYRFRTIGNLWLIEQLQHSEVCDQRNRWVWGLFWRPPMGFMELLLIRLSKALGKL